MNEPKYSGFGVTLTYKQWINWHQVEQKKELDKMGFFYRCFSRSKPFEVWWQEKIVNRQIVEVISNGN